MTEMLRERIAQAIADDGQGQADAYDPSVQYLSLEFRAGYAAATARAVEVVSEVDDETAVKPEAPQVSMEELRERIGAVVNDYTAGEDYGSGPTRYYLTVNTPNDLTAHLAAALFSGMEWLFKAVADWQALWDEKEEWEKAAKEAWQRENVLRWLHAEAMWHAEHHRAQADAQSLSLALQRSGFRSMKDQVDAMARQINRLQNQLEQVPDVAARLRAGQFQANSELPQPLGQAERVEEVSPVVEADRADPRVPCVWPPGSPEPDGPVTEVIAENDVTFTRTNRGLWHAEPPEGNGRDYAWAWINEHLTLTEALGDGRG